MTSLYRQGGGLSTMAGVPAPIPEATLLYNPANGPVFHQSFLPFGHGTGRDAMSFRRCFIIICGLIFGLVFLVACGQRNTPTPSATPTPQPTPSATPVPPRLLDRLPGAGTRQLVPGG